MYRKIWVGVLIAPLIVGCRGTKKSMLPEKQFAQQQIIAKFTDIPDAPFQLTLQNISTSEVDHEQVQFFYSFVGLQQEVIDFYQQQMERLGWQLLAQSQAQDYLVHFSKPGRLCSLLISGNRVSLYMGNKKGA